MASGPWLLRERGSGTRLMTEEFLAAHDLQPQMLTLGSNGAIKQAARAGLGVAFQSRATTALELEHGILGTVSVLEPLPRRQWFVLWPSKGPLLGHVEEFLAFVLSKPAKDADRALLGSRRPQRAAGEGGYAPAMSSLTAAATAPALIPSRRITSAPGRRHAEAIDRDHRVGEAVPSLRDPRLERDDGDVGGSTAAR